MKYLWITLIFTIIIVGCSKSEFSVPVLEPEFEANLVFSNGDFFSKKAGEENYYLFTDGYKSLDRKVYTSTLTESLECQEDCNSSLAIELHQGSDIGDFLDLVELDYLSANDQNVRHSLMVENQLNSNFQHSWNVQGGTESLSEALSVNQNLGKEDELNVTLKYQSESKAFIHFKQTFKPLKSSNYNIRVGLTKSGNQTKVNIAGENISQVLWANGIDSISRNFTGTIREVITIITVNSQNIKVLISLDEDHPSFEEIGLGYSYVNTVMPEEILADIKEVEIIFQDENGLKFRSSFVDQVLPHYFELKNPTIYIDNELGQETYTCDLEFSCLVRNKQNNLTKYIKEGRAKYAFIKKVE